jgi:hypothetical protein
MAWQLEITGTANAVKTAIAAVTGANATETTMLGVAIPMLINQINAIGGPYFYCYFAGTYQNQTAQRLTTILCPLKALLTDGSYPLNVPPQGN